MNSSRVFRAEQDTVLGLSTVCGTLTYTVLLVAPSFVPPRTPLAKWVSVAAVLGTVFFPLLAAAAFVFALSAQAGRHDAYWGHASAPWWHGPPGNHDFCEENYAYSSFVAEFHNTWSSLLIISYGAVGSWYTRRFATTENRFAAAFLSIGSVGVGSALFHGNLLRWGQILDEAPMLFLLFSYAYILIEDEPRPKHGIWLPVLLVASCLTFVGTYLVFYNYMIFLGGFVGGSLLLVCFGAVAARGASRLCKALFVAGFLSLVTGTACWVIDDVGCAVAWPPIRLMRLHIGWHVLTGLAGYLFVLAAVAMLAAQLGGSRRPALYLWCGGLKGWRVAEDDRTGKLVWTRAPVPDFLLPYVAIETKRSA